MNNNNLKSLIKKLPVKAKREGWVFTYDQDEGVFFYSPKRIPDKSELHQISDEFSIYVDRQLNPQGLTIEYFRNNFLEHHKEMKALGEDIFGGFSKTQTIDPSQKGNKEIAKFKALLESTLIDEAGKSFRVIRNAQ